MSLDGVENVTYMNFSQIGQYVADTIDSTFNFSQVVIDPSGKQDYYLSVEKFSMPIQLIPMFKKIDRAIAFTAAGDTPITTDANGNFESNENGTGGKIKDNSWHSLEDVFSIGDLLNRINAIEPPNTTDKNLEAELTSGGRLKITNQVPAWNIVMSKECADLLQFPTGRLANAGTVNSTCSILNHIETVKKIVLTSYDLNTAAEISPGVRSKEITSIAFSNNYSMSIEAKKQSSVSLTYSPRQDVVYEPNFPKYHKLSGTPITSVSLRGLYRFVEYVGNDTAGVWRLSEANVPLPRGGVFSIKLAFWQRK